MMLWGVYIGTTHSLFLVKNIRNGKLDLYRMEARWMLRVIFSLSIIIINEYGSINFLDFNFNLLTNTYEDYRKLISKLECINSETNFQKPFKPFFIPISLDTCLLHLIVSTCLRGMIITIK